MEKTSKPDMYEVTFQLNGDDPTAQKLHDLVQVIAARMSASVQFYQTMVVNVRTDRPDVATVLRMIAEGSKGVAVIPAGNGGNGAAKPKAKKAAPVGKDRPTLRAFDPASKETEKKLCVECRQLRWVNDDGLCKWCAKRLAKELGASAAVTTAGAYEVDA